ncbi:EAL domain-containing protein [Undibacterium sp. Xuan67W]|uniref:EAL domain-containing protein n=1 Tax=Undibacterium sp. Xuan67W TaxID=3413057 RepID=UPI003BF39A22
MNEKRLELVMEAADLDLWENDFVTGVVTRKATKIFAALGYDENETANYIDDLFAIVHPDDLAGVKEALNNHINGITEKYQCEFRFRAKHGSWVWYANHGRIMDAESNNRGQRFIGVTFNIEERKRKEIERESLTRTLKMLGECNSELIHARSEQSLLESICKLLVETGGYLMAWIGFAEQDAAKSISVRAHWGDRNNYLDQIAVTWLDTESGSGPSGKAIKTNSVIINQDFAENHAMEPWREKAAKHGFQSSIALPITNKNGVFAVLNIYAPKTQVFKTEEVKLLKELADNLSYGIAALRLQAENTQAQIALKKENEKNLALLHNASDGIHILDSQGKLIEASDSFCAMLGYTRDEMIGKHLYEWDVNMCVNELEHRLAQVLSHKARTQFESRHKRKDGTMFDVEVSDYALELEGKQVLFNSSRDITERKKIEASLLQQQQELIQSNARHRDLLTNLHVAIIVHAPDSTIIFSNPRASELLGLSVDQMLGKTAIDPSWRFVNDKEETMTVDEYPVQRVIATMKPLEALVLGVKSTNKKRVVWLLVNAFPELDADGKLKQVVVNFDDISARKQAEERIHNLAFFDALTGLPNRRLLMDRFDSAISTSTRSNHYGAVLFIDMDRFKTINDILGHNFGDQLLIEVAQRIQACIRETDTVARLGGDEFIVLLVELDESIETASQKTALIAEKIRANLAAPYHLNESEQHSSPSIGVSVYQGNKELPETLLKQADIAMYKAKDAGRNTLRFFNPAMQLAVETRAALEADLRHAVPSDELRLYYQIQVDDQQRPIGAEALVSWLHPDRGLVMPMQFIPIAEESSLILEIGEWVIRTACQQLVKWSKSDHTRHLTVAVNVSAQQFRQTDFVEHLASLLHHHGVDASKLKLELTESVVLTDVDEVISKMIALKELGVKLSMDDFGTGYSSLSYLKRLPLDQIKIDQSFVRDITTDSNDAVMVKTIIDLAKNFRLDVIAEGVETEEQLAFLKLHECMAYQGYLFSKPIPVNVLDGLLNTFFVH